jgi:hypothetical protein
MDDVNNFVKVCLLQPKNVPVPFSEIIVRSLPVVDLDALLVFGDVSQHKQKDTLKIRFRFLAYQILCAIPKQIDIDNIIR